MKFFSRVRTLLAATLVRSAGMHPAAQWNFPNVTAGTRERNQRGGMAVYVGIYLEPGDLMKVEFETFHSARVTGITQ